MITRLMMEQERDYIHIEDLVDGHLSAIEYLKQFNGYDAINLGTGKSYSVLELISAFEKTNDTKINYEICDRRKGDVARCFSDVSKSKNFKLGSKKELKRYV